MLRLNEISLEWEEVAEMLYRREQHDCTSWDGSIIVAGGQGDLRDAPAGNEHELFSVERYNEATDTWTLMENLPELPGIPEIPEIPGTPEIPEIPGTSEIPEIPEKPEIPGMPRMPRIPEIPRISQWTYLSIVSDNQYLYAIAGGKNIYKYDAANWIKVKKSTGLYTS